MARKSSSKILTSAQLNEVAKLFAVLSDPSRLRILNALMGDEHTVNELVEVLGLGQANASKHLGQLYQAGLISREKEGTKVRYAVCSPLVKELCDLVCESVTKNATERLRQLVGR